MNETQVKARRQALGEWVTRVTGIAEPALQTASADASFRRYYRLAVGAGTLNAAPAATSVIAMDAPAPQEDLGRFVRLAGAFADIGMPVPQVFASDLSAGFALIGDLGPHTFLDAFEGRVEVAGVGAVDWLTGEAKTGAEHVLYPAALDLLVAQQSRGEVMRDQVPDYDEALLRRELGIFDEWFIQGLLCLPAGFGDIDGWQALVDYLVASATAQPQVLVHRDFHSRNLVPGAPPGVLDFQDAVWGPVTYDLVSLLRDCYVAWPARQVDAWLGDYLEKALLAGVPVGKPAMFREAFDLMGLQRHLKAIGIFARLHLRDGRSHYLPDIPRVLDYVREVSAAPALGWLHRRLAEQVSPRIEAALVPGRDA